jgi:hypothetical protein
MTMNQFRKPLASVLLAILALGVPLLASSQDDDRTWLQVRTVHVKPDRFDDFVDLQIKLSEAQQAAGQTGRSVWQEIRGDLGTFHIVDSVDNLAELDEPFEPPMEEEEWAAWIKAIYEVTESSSRTILRSHLEWSIPADEDSAPGLLVLRSTTVAPNKMYDYHGWLQDQLVPALRKGGAKGVSFNHTVFGGDRTTWVSGSRIPNWAALQRRRGSLAYMSDEDYIALMEPLGEMVTASDLRVLRYRADLSN